MAGWGFDIVLGAVLGAFVSALPLVALDLLVGIPGWLAVAGQLVGVLFGIRFMRQARSATGPAWLVRRGK